MSKKFEEITETIILIDFSNVVYRSFHATKSERMINSENINVGFILGMIKILRHAINRAKELTSVPKLVICQDRTPTRKRNLYVKYQESLDLYSSDKEWNGKDKTQRIRYKGNRIKEDLPYNILQIAEQFIKCLSCDIIYCDGEEADDVISSFVYKNKHSNIILYSTDKDLWQLLDKFHNLRIILSDGSEPSDELMIKHFQTTDKNKIALHKILRGDSGDNVKSILRFPFKKNINIYEKCNGSIEDYVRLMIKEKGENNQDVQLFMKFLKVSILNQELVKLKFNLKYKTETFESNKENWNKLCMIYETPSIYNSPMLNIY